MCAVYLMTVSKKLKTENGIDRKLNMNDVIIAGQARNSNYCNNFSIFLFDIANS